MLVREIKPVVLEAIKKLPDEIQEFLIDSVDINITRRPVRLNLEDRKYGLMGVFGITVDDEWIIDLYSERFNKFKKVIFVTYHEVAHAWLEHTKQKNIERTADNQARIWYHKYYPNGYKSL